MKTIIPAMLELIHKQTSFFFLSQALENQENIKARDIEIALLAFQKCTAKLKGKYSSSRINPQDFYIADKYAVFLYYLSRSLYLSGKIQCATQVYRLNKMLHGFDAFYEVELPEIFTLTHPVGSVLGRATYRNYFCAYQNCGVGSYKSESALYYPSFGEGVVLYSGARVIGKCNIGSNVIFGANAFIINTDIPNNAIVVGTYPNHRILPNTRNTIDDLFFVKQQEKGDNTTKQSQKTKL